MAKVVSSLNGGRTVMYWDDTIIFGLVTVALMIVFMIGWVAFIIRDHRRKKVSPTQMAGQARPNVSRH